jgi:hypothetical protein
MIVESDESFERELFARRARALPNEISFARDLPRVLARAEAASSGSGEGRPCAALVARAAVACAAAACLILRVAGADSVGGSSEPASVETGAMASLDPREPEVCVSPMSAPGAAACVAPGEGASPGIGLTCEERVTCSLAGP